MNALRFQCAVLVMLFLGPWAMRRAAAGEPEGELAESIPRGLPRLIVPVLRDETFRLVSLDAGNLREQPLVAEPEAVLGPAVSPDGKWLAFVSYREKTGYICVANLVMGAALEISDTGARGHSPAWSTNGKRIAFSRAGFDNLFIMNRDGSNVVNLTNTRRSMNADPAWSPDGKRIAFVSTSGADPFRLHAINTDGSDRRLLCEYQLGGFIFPDWSHDGKRIVLSQLSVVEGRII